MNNSNNEFIRILENQGVNVNKLPLNYHLLEVMNLMEDSSIPEREVESTFYRSQKYLCQMFHKPISSCHLIGNDYEQECI